MKKTNIRWYYQAIRSWLGGVSRFGELIDSVIFGIAQEASLDVERHAQTSQFEIRM
ncbi:MAG: hypothetical protein ABI351_06535 [Herbaspirillum sp.]